jgi:hypothetical protein
MDRKLFYSFKYVNVTSHFFPIASTNLFTLKKGEAVTVAEAQHLKKEAVFCYNGRQSIPLF